MDPQVVLTGSFPQLLFIENLFKEQYEKQSKEYPKEKNLE